MASPAHVLHRVLSYPWALLGLMTVVTLVACWFVRDFTFDASADTLVVEGDPRLATYQKMNEQFGGDEFLVLAYKPREDSLFTRSSLASLDQLQREIAVIEGVAGVFSILDAPLIESPPVPIAEMSTGYKTLRDEDVDLTLARDELTSSPLFRNYLVSPDGESSVVRVDLKHNQELIDLRRERDRLRGQGEAGQGDELAGIESAYNAERERYVEERRALIERVRHVRARYETTADVYISGVPMIAADMIEFVKRDLAVFGGLVFFLIVGLLAFFFRRIRWVVLPIVISALSILITMGVLGFVQKPVTVISSNFISLLAIICISFSIHLIVRYRELLGDDPDIDHHALVFETMESKFAPCVYTGLTTMLAFGSMMGSRIVPVEDFGWMMCLGILVSFFVTYTVFPALLLVMGKGTPSSTLGQRVELTMKLCEYCVKHTGGVLAVAFFVLLIALGGLTKVSFENRFVDYFDDDTDIHKGMVYIDQHLGGTVPFDVYLQLGRYETEPVEDDFFSAPTSDDDSWPARYWFTRDRIETVAALHDRIASHGATGKVISVATLEQLARKFNDGEPLSNLKMAYVLGELPETVRSQLVAPYAKPETGYARLNARVRESGPRFSRDDLIADIRQFATGELGLAPDDVVVTGMMVLFNDMLRQLVDSQLRTLLYVVGATFLMFALLLGSAKLALLALIPNVIAAATVISVMGFSAIPMDMMTITIAAISIGIGVDDAIHYLHRFREEYRESHDVRAAVTEAHGTIGRAMYFTSMIIVVGFSVLAFSNFLPTVYFGLLTALAMLLALLANLTVLPSLLIRFYR